MILPEMVARKDVLLSVFSKTRKIAIGLDESFDLLNFSLHLGIGVVVRGMELVVVVVERR